MIYICIPSRNEARTIGILLWKIREVMLSLNREYRILVLDDGSADDTEECLGRYSKVVPLKVIRREDPIGYGQATEALLREATRLTRYPRRDAIVIMQGDFTEDPSDLPEFIKSFERGFDIVAGQLAPPDLDARESRAPRSVRVARWVAKFLLARSHRWSAPASDPFCGFRVYRAIVARKALQNAGSGGLLTHDGWAANAELLTLLAPFARKIGEVPIRLRYDRRWRRTRVRVLATAKEVFRLRSALPQRLSRGEAA